MKKILVLFAAIIMMFVVSGCSSTSPAKTTAASVATNTETQGTTALASNSILIENHAFNPGVLTIKAGDSVTWTNKDSVSHSVVFADFESGLLKKGDSFTHVFDTAGSFKYNCGPHPDMTGTIEVQ